MPELIATVQVNVCNHCSGFDGQSAPNRKSWPANTNGIWWIFRLPVIKAAKKETIQLRSSLTHGNLSMSTTPGNTPGVTCSRVEIRSGSLMFFWCSLRRVCVLHPLHDCRCWWRILTGKKKKEYFTNKIQTCRDPFHRRHTSSEKKQQRHRLVLINVSPSAWFEPPTYSSELPCSILNEQPAGSLRKVKDSRQLCQ